MNRLIRSNLAKRDLIELADYLAAESPEVAERFLLAAETTFQFLLNTPRAGAPREWLNPLLVGLRMWPVRGFERVLIFYQTVDAQVRIVRLLHSARDIETALDPEDET